MTPRTLLAGHFDRLDDDEKAELLALAAIGRDYLERMAIEDVALTPARAPAPPPPPVARPRVPKAAAKAAPVAVDDQAAADDGEPMSLTERTVLQAVVGADDAVASSDILASTKLSKNAVLAALRVLLDRGAVFRGGEPGSRHTRYAVTQEAADAAYRAAKRA